MGIHRQDRFHASAVRIIYEECGDHRPYSSFQESFSERAWVGYADAHVLYEPSGTWINREAASRTAKSQKHSLRAHQTGEGIGGEKSGLKLSS